MARELGSALTLLEGARAELAVGRQLADRRLRCHWCAADKTLPDTMCRAELGPAS